MCSSKPKVPKIQPVQAPPPLPPPPPRPEPTPEAPVLNYDTRKRQDERKAKRSGTRSLRIDLSIPSSAAGINIPN
jgi:hypothetical protein